MPTSSLFTVPGYDKWAIRLDGIEIFEEYITTLHIADYFRQLVGAVYIEFMVLILLNS